MSVKDKKLMELGQSISSLLASLKKDLLRVESLHKAKRPKKFTNLRGLKIESRYLSGLASGGDYMDVFESKVENGYGILFSNVTTYRFSMALMDALSPLVKKLTHLGEEGVRKTPLEIGQELFKGLKSKFTEKDQWSFLVGLISLKDQTISFMNTGDLNSYYSDRGQPFLEMPKDKKTMSMQSQEFNATVHAIQLARQGRIVFISPGFSDLLGGRKEVLKFLNEFREKESVDLLNELAFLAKTKVDPGLGMPARDCTAAIVEIDSPLLKLT